MLVTAQTTLTFPFSFDEGCDDQFSPFEVRLHALSLRVPWIHKSCLRGVYVQSIGVDEIERGFTFMGLDDVMMGVSNKAVLAKREAFDYDRAYQLFNDQV